MVQQGHFPYLGNLKSPQSSSAELRSPGSHPCKAQNIQKLQKGLSPCEPHAHTKQFDGAGDLCVPVPAVLCSLPGLGAASPALSCEGSAPGLWLCAPSPDLTHDLGQLLAAQWDARELHADAAESPTQASRWLLGCCRVKAGAAREGDSRIREAPAATLRWGQRSQGDGESQGFRGLQRQRVLGENNGQVKGGLETCRGCCQPGTGSHHTGMQSSARGWWQGWSRPRLLAAQSTQNAQPRPQNKHMASLYLLSGFEVFSSNYLQPQERAASRADTQPVLCPSLGMLHKALPWGWHCRRPGFWGTLQRSRHCGREGTDLPSSCPTLHRRALRQCFSLWVIACSPQGF